MKMNKNILTVSLIAVMACGAARADIASTKYVDDKIQPVTETVTTLTEKVTTLTGDGDGAAATKADIANMQIKANIVDNETNYGSLLNSTEKYPSMNVMRHYVARENLNKQPASDEDYQLGNAAGSWTTMTDEQIDALNSGVTADVVKQVATNTANITALQTKDAEIEGKIGTVPEGKTLSSMISQAQADATYDDTALANRVTTIESTVNNTTTGLAATKTIADNAKSAAATAQTAAEAAQAAVDSLTTQVTTNTANITNLGNDKLNKTFTGDANKNKAVITDASGNIVTGQVTNDMISGVAANKVTGLSNWATQIPALPAACSQTGVECALTVFGGAYTWQVVKYNETNNQKS